LQLAIDWPRAELYARIDQRVDERMEQGMIEEVRQLLAAGLDHERLEAFGLEYRYISRLLCGAFATEAEMVQRLKFAIHDFTRRQLTWLRKDQRIIWIDRHQLADAHQRVSQFL
jgi:tRNA dimethylallyltransferase